jgi:hypothetical protein
MARIYSPGRADTWLDDLFLYLLSPDERFASLRMAAGPKIAKKPGQNLE